MKTKGEVQQEIHYLAALAQLPCDNFRHEVIVSRFLFTVPFVATSLDAWDLALSGTNAFATFQRTGTPNTGIKVFDVSNPDSPALSGGAGATQRFGRVFYPGSGTELYVKNVSLNRFQSWDITVPTAPVLQSFIASFDGGIFTLGTTAYTCSGFADRIILIDITLPGALALISSTRTDLFAVPVIGPDSCWTVGTNMYVLNMSGTPDPIIFMTVDVTVPAAPVQAATLVLAASGADPNAERTGLVVSGNTAYMVWSTKLFIVDITNPLAPALLSSTTVATTSARDLVLTGTTLYIAADAKMLKYNVSNPAAPVLVHSTTTQSQAFAPAILDASHVLMLDSFDFGVGTGDFLEVLAA